jgi:D-glycero-alpha-D-manno-heptose-7-phosphate kinase
VVKKFIMHSSLPQEKSVLAQAPCRADLAGGTLDLWPLYLFHPGAVTVNFAVSIFASCRITPQPGRAIRLRSLDTKKEDAFADFEELTKAKQPKHTLGVQLVKFFQPECGFILETNSESPAGAGISGSSALMIAATAALAKFTGRKLDPEQMRTIAQNIEAQLIQVPTGCQDYYPAIFGGVNSIHLDAAGIRREKINVAAEEIDERFIVVYTGAPRQSGINNWEVFKAHINGDKKVVKNFETISEIAQGMHQAVSKADWDQVAYLLREEWKLRRSNYDQISTPLIDRLVTVAAKTGGRAAKVCGAGGGGCVLFMVKDGARERVIEALRINGGEVLPCKVSSEGLSVKAQLASSTAARA